MGRFLFYKTLVLFLFIFGIILGVNPQAYAFSNTSTHIGLRAGVSEYHFDNEGNVSSSELAGLTGGIRKGPLELELAVDYTQVVQNFTRIEGFGTGGSFVGDIRIFQIRQDMLRLILSGKYYFLEETNTWNPYFGIGGGGYIPIKNDSEAPTDNTLVPGGTVTTQTDIEFKNIFGAQFSAGTDFRFKPNLSLGLEFRYFILRSDFEADSGRAKTVDPGRITIIEYGTSLKYHFPN